MTGAPWPGYIDRNDHAYRDHAMLRLGDILMSQLTRRDFLQGAASLTALAGTAMLTVAGAAQTQSTGESAAPRGANERVNIACIGVRGRGYDHIRGLAGRHNCTVTQVCDVDQAPGMNHYILCRRRHGSQTRSDGGRRCKRSRFDQPLLPSPGERINANGRVQGAQCCARFRRGAQC